MGGTLIITGLILFAMSAITALPLRVMMELNVSRQPTLNVHIGVIGLYTDMRGRLVRGGNGWIIDISHGQRAKPRELNPQSMIDRARKFAALTKGSIKAQHKLLRQIRVKDVGLECRLGTGDAASTALICGLLESTMWSLCSVAHLIPHISINPDYSRRALVLTINGMFSVPVGHIISAAATVAFEYGKGRIKAWIKQRNSKAIPSNTQSKA